MAVGGVDAADGSRVLLWFRSDLRVRDNTALHHAMTDSTRGVVGVFVICARQWRGHDWGMAKADFVLRNARELSAALERLRVPLRVLDVPKFAAAPAALAKLADEVRCDALYFNEEHEVNERERDAAVRKRFEQDKRRVRAFRDQTILDVSKLRTTVDGWYSVFTPFKRRWLAELDASPPADFLAAKRQSVAPCASDPVPPHIDGFTGGVRPDLWPAGEEEAQRRLTRFVEQRIGGYAAQRDTPGVNGTSTLSPYLAAGVISPRECLRAALAAREEETPNAQKGIDTWISELIWREFYRHVLIGFPQVCRGRPFRAHTDELPWRGAGAEFEAWCAGRTGVPIVDAGMRQLVQTGWMHNRLRMITAMFLTKDLFVDWRLGERFFMRHLIDGDFASNNGGWQWSASTGTDAAPYFRIFNPFTQGRKFDADGAFIRRFVPELAECSNKVIHAPHEHGGVAGYPAPIVDHAEARKTTIAAFRALSTEAS